MSIELDHTCGEKDKQHVALAVEVQVKRKRTWWAIKVKLTSEKQGHIPRNSFIDPVRTDE